MLVSHTRFLAQVSETAALLICKIFFKQQIHPILLAMKDTRDEKFAITYSIINEIRLDHDTAISWLD